MIGYNSINDYLQISIQHPQSIIIMEKTHTFEMHCKFVRDLMKKDQYKGRHEEQVNQILSHRINKFYSTNDFIQVDQEHFKPRLQPCYTKGIEPSNDTLILFGIDFMKKQKLKQYFYPFQFEFHFIDQSNCILSFQSTEAALNAIRTNAKPDSATRFKVEEDLDQQLLTQYNINLGNKGKQPKQWIQLKPYIYKYKQRHMSAKQFERKLYVRFATTRQKQAGFDKGSFIDGMISKCKAIWENEAKKDHNLRVFLQKKMLQLNQRRKKMQQPYQNNRDRNRSRSRDRQNSHLSNDINTKANKFKGVDKDLSFQIHSRSSSEFNILINEFDKLNLCIEQKSIFGHADSLKGKDSTGLSGAPEIGYKLAQPSQLRVQFKNDKFNYRKYIEQTQQKEQKQKICFIDLANDD